MKKENNNHWLDLCRAIAIMMVLVSHGRGYLIPIWEPFNGMKFGGFIGVELFFTLSGFLIGRIIIEKSVKNNVKYSWIPSFYFRRWARTYPMYILFLLLNTALLLGIRVTEVDNIFPYLFFTQSLTSPHPVFFGEAWSLAIEEIFYFITPILYISIYFFIKDSRKSILISLLLMIIMPFLYRCYISTQTNLSFNDIRTISLARLDSIAYGFIYAWILYFNIHSKNIALLIAKVLSFFLPLLIYISHLPDNIINDNIYCKILLFNFTSLACASLVVCGLNIKLPSVLLLPVKIIARGSYISYLINLPILYLMHKIIPPQSSILQGVSLWLMYLISTLLISCIMHELLEKKILELRDRISPR